MSRPLPSDQPLSGLSQAASSLLGRAFLFIAVVTVAATLGTSLAAQSCVPPWLAAAWFVGGGVGTVVFGGWGLVVYPVVLLTMLLYLWKELPHYTLLVPALFVTPYMYHLADVLKR